jgi:hypothetical protein
MWTVMVAADSALLPVEPPSRRWLSLPSICLRLFGKRAAELPDDLNADVGLDRHLPTDRCDAFWFYRRSSRMRDLPL